MPVPSPDSNRAHDAAARREVVLANDDVRVVVEPAQGGRVQHVADLRSGRELLWQGSASAWPREDFLAGNPGGWDVIFPNDAPWGDYPDHGALWRTALDVQRASDAAALLAGGLTDPAVSVEVSLSLLESPRRGVRLETTLKALSDTGPMLLASHPLLAVEDGWRIEAADGTLRVDEGAPGRFAAGASPEGGERERALLVEAPGTDEWEVMFLDGASTAAVASPDGRRRTRLTWSGYGHLWIVRTGEGPGLTLQLEPSTSHHYTLEAAIDAGTAFELTAGEHRAFVVELESEDAVA